MIKEKILKIVTAGACIATLIMPHTSVVLASVLTNSSDVSGRVDTVELKAIPYHESGYAYQAKQAGKDLGTEILKILQKDGINYDYANEFYCIDVNNSFPMLDGYSYNYKRAIEDFFAGNPSNQFPANEGNHTYFHPTDEEYNSLCWLLKNMYLRKQMSEEARTEQLNSLLSNACADLLNAGFEEIGSVDDIKALINEDDIEIVQQWAIWYFTNNGEATLQDIDIVQRDSNGNITLPMLDVTRLSTEYDNMNPEKYKILNYLYRYFIKTAEENSTLATNESYPSIVQTNPTSVVDGSDYKIGPFKISASSDVKTSSYSVKLMSGNNEITNYTIKDEQGNTLSQNIASVLNTNYYIYLPVAQTDVSNIQLKLNYYDTKASVWKKVLDNNDMEYDETHQPVILITRELEEENISLKVNPDLALRKYIIAVNDTQITNRTPQVDISGLRDGSSTTAVYKHRKDAVEVKVGDTVTYRITVYNEGNVEAKVSEIVDYLPAGLELATDNEINNNFGWTISENGTVITTKVTEGTSIPAFGNSLQGTYVDVVCKVTDKATSGAILTNIAEIKADNINDRDSSPDSLANRISSIDKSTYTGSENKEDLSDSNYFYKGSEDDDDFEKLIVAGKAFDLSLQKFITKVNGKTVTPSREPKVNTNPLKNGSTNAEYTTVKTPVFVQKGDIVTYTIRVYNEGEEDGYAESIADYLPDGLGYLVNYNENINNYWAIPTDSQVNTVKLNQVVNGTKNLKVTDFTGVTDLNNVDVVKGAVKLTSTALNSSKSDNLIKAFDGSDKLSYKEVQITCIVLEDSNLRNIAEITNDSDANKNEVTDRDSTPDTVDPNNYPGNDQNQDDHDYEILVMKKFDLALQKFITAVNDKEIKDRVPKVSLDENKKIKYEHPETALEVNHGDIVTYTIRVYNEGEVDGYAAEINDDIPNGLEFDSNNEINKKYGWVMVDANGNVTKDASKATEIRTDYLSKQKAEARKESALLTAFDSEKGNLFFLDVKVAFKVNSKASNNTIINTAEITKDTDSEGNEIDDIDSTPNNKKEGEDDIDQERIHVGYFDLALQKDLKKAIVTEGSSTKEIIAQNGELKKVEINRKKINSTIVKFVYTITIKNEGTIPGYAKEIKDYIPEGLQFVEADDKNWKAGSDGTITTEALANTLLKPGESASVEVTLRWINNENNMGTKINVAEISKDYNEAGDVDDIDSTPDNKKEGEDDIDDAPVILTIATGRAPVYVILTTAVLVIIGTGVVAIKKYVL